MIVNDPAIVAELAALYPRYEQALVSNDVDTLVSPSNSPSNLQTGRMTAARWQQSYEQLKALSILHGPLDPTAAYTLQSLP
jgi:hypothetical protein